MSAIRPESWEYLQIFETARRMHEVAGASLLGPDMGKWPAWVVDVFTALSSERIKVDNARYEAEKRARD